MERGRYGCRFVACEVRQVVDEQQRFCKDAQAAVAVSRETKRKIAQDKAVLPKFAVGDFVLYARVRRQGVTRS